MDPSCRPHPFLGKDHHFTASCDHFASCSLGLGALAFVECPSGEREASEAVEASAAAQAGGALPAFAFTVQSLSQSASSAGSLRCYRPYPLIEQVTSCLRACRHY